MCSRAPDGLGLNPLLYASFDVHVVNNDIYDRIYEIGGKDLGRCRFYKNDYRIMLINIVIVMKIFTFEVGIVRIAKNKSQLRPTRS